MEGKNSRITFARKTLRANINLQHHMMNMYSYCLQCTPGLL